MRRSSRYFGLLIVAYWLGSCASATDPRVAAVAGEYIRPHEVNYFDGESWHRTATVDRIKLSPAGEGRINFHLSITANNHHTCEVEGEAVRAGDSFEFHDDPANAFENAEPCFLRITPGGETVVVEDVGSNCRLEYCGARASIGRSEFRRE